MDLEGVKILLVDDEEDIREFLGYVLKNTGAEISMAENGEEAIEIAHKTIPDIIVLDKMMPIMDGVMACIELRKDEKFNETKIIILSAISDLDSQIEGLDIGADDYLVKPIKSKLLISKLKAQLRQTKNQSLKDILSYKHILVDRNKFIVQKGEEEVKLPKKEFELLYLLMSKPDKVFRREEILDNVWGKDIVIGDRTIDVHIRKLREKIGDEYFVTIKGIGYKFIAF